MGDCYEATSPERMQNKLCDQMPCTGLITDPTRTVLNCNSKVDVVIVLDGSASLGNYGWWSSKEAAKSLVTAFGASSDAHVALLLFGGPDDLDLYDRCVGASNDTSAVDMEAECGMHWVSHFTADMQTLAAKVQNMVFPESTTMTSLALTQAETELFNGRDDAESVVILITDGWPMSRKNTNSAAAQLRKSAKVLYVAAGNSAPLDLIREMASYPQDDHIIQAHSLWSLSQPDVLNKIIGSTCMSVS